MKPIRLIALDVDGTLLDPHEEVRPRVRAAIREAIERGCLITLATGRRFAGASHIAEDLGLALPLILHGGSVVQDSATGAVIYQDPIEPDAVEGLLRMLLPDHPVAIYESPAFGGRVFTGPAALDNEPLRLYDQLRGPFVRVTVEELFAIRHVLSLVTFSRDPGALRALAGRVGALDGASPLLTRWTLIDDDALEIFREGCSKASALAHLAAAHGIEMDEVMAIGDGLNDCEILAAVGLGVAMGNACPEARAAARIQVGTNEQDGVAEAIERYVLRPA
jgi:hydroxymethylpyrimidine pyrophosphatase-like HAD family hydrolase